jgi:hypothetical protein
MFADDHCLSWQTRNAPAQDQTGATPYSFASHLTGPKAASAGYIGRATLNKAGRVLFVVIEDMGGREKLDSVLGLQSLMLPLVPVDLLDVRLRHLLPVPWYYEKG